MPSFIRHAQVSLATYIRAVMFGCFQAWWILSKAWKLVFKQLCSVKEKLMDYLWDKFIVHYRLPEEILMDQGWNFESQLVADLCKLMGTWKILTSLFHPQTNGQWERFNSTLINMLGTLPKEKKSEWKNHIEILVYTYNCTWNSATGFSPYYLMFGRQPCLLVDVTLGLAPCTITEPYISKFIQKIREHARWAQRKAKAFQAKEVQRHKWNYD